MTKRLLGAALIAVLSATRLLAQDRWQAVLEAHPRPDPDPLYAKARLDPGLPSYKPIGTLSGQFQGAYQDLNTWITEAWAAGFKKIYPNVEFVLKYESPFGSIPSLRAGALQFAVHGRELLDPDRDAFRKKQGVEYDPLVVAVAGGSYRTMGFTDPFVFFVNKENPIERLSLAQLDAMYSTTRNRGYKEDIKTWGQLGLTGEWADKPVILMGVTPPNGYEGFLRERVLKGGKLKEGIYTRDTVFPLPYLVGFAPHTIGYASLSFLTPCTKYVKQIDIAEDDGGPYYKGTFEEVLTQKYPLSRVIYISVHRVPGQPLDPRLKEFLRFILSRDGQQVVMNDGIFLPLPAWIVDRELAKLE
jgi:phosphate transport system substrate-binding protein